MNIPAQDTWYSLSLEELNNVKNQLLTRASLVPRNSSTAKAMNRLAKEAEQLALAVEQKAQLEMFNAQLEKDRMLNLELQKSLGL